MRNVSPRCPAPSPSHPRARKLTDIYYRVDIFSAASISSSSVRRRNNLIPYSRGGCRPWRIEWNKIKPRILRVLWRGSFPTQAAEPHTHFGRVRACLHIVSFCLLVLLVLFMSHSLILFSPLISSLPCISARRTVLSRNCPFADDSSVSNYISGLPYYWRSMVFRVKRLREVLH